MRNHAPHTADHLTERLRRDGYCIVSGAADPALIARLDADLAGAFAATPFGTGNFYGERTKRFGRLLARSQWAAPLVLHRLIITVAA